MQNSKNMGDVIRQLRKKNGLTIKKAVDRLEECGGYPITESLFGMWERNERNVPSDQIIALAKALSCTVYDLFSCDPPSTDIQAKRRTLLDRIMSLPEDELEIIWNVSHLFEGNLHPLIHCIGMYISMDADARAESALALLETYRREKEEGKLVESAPGVNLEFTLDEWKRLIK